VARFHFWVNSLAAILNEVGATATRPDAPLKPQARRTTWGFFFLVPLPQLRGSFVLGWRSRGDLTGGAKTVSLAAVEDLVYALCCTHDKRPLRRLFNLIVRIQAMHNFSMFTADRLTHLKIVGVSLIFATTVAGIGLAARMSDVPATNGRMEVAVIKVGDKRQ
jgi:hypothetical protein